MQLATDEANLHAQLNNRIGNECDKSQVLLLRLSSVTLIMSALISDDRALQWPACDHHQHPS